LILSLAEVVAVVDSSTTMREGNVDSTAEVIEVRPHEAKPQSSQVPITVRRASTSKAPTLAPLVIVRQNSSEGVIRCGSSDTVIVENVQRSNSQ
jgi:hypothetical protein